MSNSSPYPTDSVNNHPQMGDHGYAPDDDGTMPKNVEALETSVIGRRIVKAERVSFDEEGFDYCANREWWVPWRGEQVGLVLTLDDGRRVALVDTADCCAYTELSAFLLNPEMVDHVITGVASTDGYTKWHIFADYGDILQLTVNWSAGNPFYYAYGFDILVSEMPE